MSNDRIDGLQTKRDLAGSLTPREQADLDRLTAEQERRRSFSMAGELWVEVEVEPELVEAVEPLPITTPPSRPSRPPGPPPPSRPVEAPPTTTPPYQRPPARR